MIHTCCANCLIYPLGVLQGEGWECVGFFYNPNIHPYQEYRRRLETLQQYERQAAVSVIYRDHYDLEGFLRAVAFREADRCRVCYNMRLEAAAKEASQGGFDAFTTTLLYSRHQNHELIASIGESAGKRAGVLFLYKDFRVGWKEGIKRSKALGLYRQNYCGCIYSEKERYIKDPTS